MPFSAIQWSKRSSPRKAIGWPRLEECPRSIRLGKRYVHSWMLQIAATAAVVLYLGHWRLTLQQRRNQSWDDLVSQLHPAWPALLAPNPGANSQFHRAAQLWSLSRNARVIQEIADHALRNFHSVDRALAEQMHCDATYLRFWALAALARYMLGRPA
jgi:hypothetical protein